MNETFSALARALPGEQDQIRALMKARPDFAGLVGRYEALEKEAAKLLDELSAVLIEVEEDVEDRRTL